MTATQKVDQLVKDIKSMVSKLEEMVDTIYEIEEELTITYDIED